MYNISDHPVRFLHSETWVEYILYIDANDISKHSTDMSLMVRSLPNPWMSHPMHLTRIPKPTSNMGSQLRRWSHTLTFYKIFWPDIHFRSLNDVRIRGLAFGPHNNGSAGRAPKRYATIGEQPLKPLRWQPETRIFEVFYNVILQTSWHSTASPMTSICQAVDNRSLQI